MICPLSTPSKKAREGSPPSGYKKLTTYHLIISKTYWLCSVLSLTLQAIGCATLGLGIWILKERNYMSALVGNELMTVAAWIVIIGGGVITTISFFGCIGSITEQKCMIITVSVHLPSARFLKVQSDHFPCCRTRFQLFYYCFHYNIFQTGKEP